MAASHAKTEAADSDSDEELQNVDICRVCRCEGTADHPLFFPCVCTGSIKYIHQDCLVEWLKYSKKEYCELCKHKFRFTPIYADNMPSRLPVGVLLLGLFGSLWKGFKTWSHYTIVALAWLIVVPVFACRVHRCLFHRSVQPLVTLPGDLASFENLPSDLLQGGFLVTFTLCAFIALVWLRDQIGQAAPQWLPVEVPIPPRNVLPVEPPEAEVDRGLQAGMEPDWHDARRNDEPDTDTETDETDWSPFGSSSSGHDADYLNTDQNELRRRNSPFAPATIRRPERADEPGPSNRPADADLATAAAQNTGPVSNEHEHENENLGARRNPENGLEEPTWERLFGLDAWGTDRADQSAPNAPPNGDRTDAAAAAADADRHRPEPEDAAAVAAAAVQNVNPILNGNVNVNANANANEQEDAQRNQQELERAAEELTWERLLGLDGSWVFLEHVLWVISLNTVCVILFVFAPFHFGLYLLERLDVSPTQVALASTPAARFTLMPNATTEMFAASPALSLSLAEQHRIASDLYLSAQSAYLNVTGTYLQLAAAYTGQIDSEGDNAIELELARYTKVLANLQLHLRRGTQIEPDLVKLNALAANLTLLVTAMSNVTLSINYSPTEFEKSQHTFATSELQLALLTSDLPLLLDTAICLDEAFASAVENETEIDLNNSTETSNITDDRHQESATGRKDADANVVLVNSLEKLGYLGAALITLVGYVAIGCCLLVAYVLMTLPRAGSLRRRVARLVLLAYIVVKVALLVTLEIGVFPLCVGWWIDVCTLPLFGSSWSDRVALFGAAPGTVCFLHWIVGMIYVFYFASFVILLREVLRPGVLWFLRNLNDPEFNPIHEMIVQPATRHVRRFISSCVLFGTSVIFVLYAPVRLVRLALPAFLPFNVHHSDAPVNEISYSFLVLNLILPVLLEHVQLRAALKTCVRRWCIAVGWALDLRSYLLGDQPAVEPQAAPNADANPAPEPARPDLRPQLHENLAARHRAMLMDANAAERIEANSEADGTYMRPRGFGLRVVALVGTMWLSLSILGTLLLTVPVATGRALIAAWLTHVNGMRLVTVGDELSDSDADADDLQLHIIGNRNASVFNASNPTMSSFSQSETVNTTLTEVMNVSASLNTSLAELASASGDLLPVYVHELYTTALGLYMWWIVIRLCSLAEEWYKKNATEIVRSVKTGCIVAAKAGIVCVLMLGVLPILIGLLFDLVVIIPLRVATNQTPIYNVLNHWTFGILHMKILAALTAIGPQWWLRDELELLYANGLRNIRLTHTLSHLCYPLMASLGMALAVPYVLARTIFPLFSDDLAAQHYVLRNVYPATLSATLLLITVFVHLRQLRRLYEHIRNEHYLIGQRLVNYEQPSH